MLNLLATLLLTGPHLFGQAPQWVTPFEKHRRIDGGSAVLGATAPGFAQNGSCGGPAFSLDAEEVHLGFTVPSCYQPNTDIEIHVVWCNEAADTLTAGETVKWDAHYRSITTGSGEDADSGTIAEATTTYTQSGAGPAADVVVTHVVLPYNHADQPFVAGDTLLVEFDRDVGTDTYSGKAIVAEWHFGYFVDDLRCDYE